MMNAVGGSPGGTAPDKAWDAAKLVYGRAQDIAYHTDSILWDIASIVWSANVVLLALVFQGSSGHTVPWFALVVSPIAMVLTLFVARVCSVARATKEVAYPMCREIEKQFPSEFRPHTKIHERYPKGMGRHWVNGITTLLLAAWMYTLIAALCPLLCRK